MTQPTYRGASTVTGPPPPKKRKWLRTILALLALLVIAAIVIGFLLARRTTDDAKKDVKVQTCKADTGGGKPTAAGRIINNSSKTSTYVVRVTFNDQQKNAVSEGVATVKSVDPAKTASWELTGARSAKGPLTCVLGGVSRTHLPGQ